MINSSLDFSQTPFRQIYIGLYFIVIFIAIQIAYVFLTTGIDSRREKIGRVNIAVSIGFFIVAFNLILKLANRLVIFDPFAYQKVLYITAAGAGFAVIAITEPTFHDNRLYTIMGLICFLLYTFIDPLGPYIWIPITWSAVLMIVPVHFFYYILKNVSKTFRTRLIALLFFIVLLYAGFIMNMEKNMQAVGEDWFVYLGLLFIIIGLSAVYFTFKEIDLFIEYGWRDCVLELYIIHKESYRPLYYQNLQKQRNGTINDLDNPSNGQNPLFSGGLVGVNTLIKEITASQSSGTQGVSQINLEDKYLIIEHGDKSLFCFVTDKNLNSLRHFLRQIKNAWEKYYGSSVKNIQHPDSDTFAVMKKIVDKILSRKNVSWLNRVMGGW